MRLLVCKKKMANTATMNGRLFEFVCDNIESIVSRYNKGLKEERLSNLVKISRYKR